MASPDNLPGATPHPHGAAGIRRAASPPHRSGGPSVSVAVPVTARTSRGGDRSQMGPLQTSTETRPHRIRRQAVCQGAGAARAALSPGTLWCCVAAERDGRLAGGRIYPDIIAHGPGVTDGVGQVQTRRTHWTRADPPTVYWQINLMNADRKLRKIVPSRQRTGHCRCPAHKKL